MEIPFRNAYSAANGRGELEGERPQKNMDIGRESSLQSRLRYTIRFLFAWDLDGEWAPFGGFFEDQLHKPSRAPCRSGNGGFAITYDR